MLPHFHRRKRWQARADQNGIAGTHISTRLARCRRTSTPPRMTGSTTSRHSKAHRLSSAPSASPTIASRAPMNSKDREGAGAPERLRAALPEHRIAAQHRNGQGERRQHPPARVTGRSQPRLRTQSLSRPAGVVIAFMVATHTREIGARIALGASRARVLRDMLGDALTLVAPDIGVGLVFPLLGSLHGPLRPTWRASAWRSTAASCTRDCARPAFATRSGLKHKALLTYALPPWTRPNQRPRPDYPCRRRRALGRVLPAPRFRDRPLRRA